MDNNIATFLLHFVSPYRVPYCVCCTKIHNMGTVLVIYTSTLDILDLHTCSAYYKCFFFISFLSWRMQKELLEQAKVETTKTLGWAVADLEIIGRYFC